jgi:thiol-disulfide isomerase/thioredoxin
MNLGIPGFALFFGMLFTGGLSQGPPAKAGSDAIILRPLTFAQWQQKLASYQGRIVVVDFWATWCAPCIERFPHMVKLHERYGRTGKVRFVSMSLDDKDDPDALRRAQEFLIKQKAAFDNFRMNEITPDAFEKLDLLGIPAVMIYDEDGKLRHKLTGDNPNRQYTNEDVEAAIKLMLSGSR